MLDSIWRTLPKILIFVALGLAIDRGLTALVDPAYRQLVAGHGSIPNRAIDARAEVVVLGSSRAHRHFVPDLLGEALDASVYNAGCPGQSLPYMRGLVDLVLREYTPRLFLIHIDPQMIVDLARFDRVAALSPFMRRSDVVRGLIYERGRWERIKYGVDSVGYNDRLGDVLVVLASNEDRTRSGYVPREGTPTLQRLDEVMWPRSFALVEARLTDEPEPRRVELLREILAAARARGVTSLLVTSPRWRPVGQPEDPRRQGLMDALGEIAEQEDVSFVRITLDETPGFRDPRFFADSQHLNEQGAELFSSILAARIEGLQLLQPTVSVGLR